MKSNIALKLALVALAGICAALPSAASQSSAKADKNGVSITGQVSCSRFGRGAVTARKGMSVAQTIQYCVAFQGADYTLVSGNKIYRLTGSKDMLAKMSGQTVTVAGQMVPESSDVATVALMGTVAVSEVVPAKD
jgi:microcystin-dependent protein